MKQKGQQVQFINQKPQISNKYAQSILVNNRMINQRVNNQTLQRTGHWTEKENAKYYAFLTKFKHKFDEKESRRQWKVFKALSEFIKSRNPNQCRSHHHKMQKNFKTIEENLDFLIKKRPELDKRSEKYIIQLETQQSKLFPEGNLKNFQIANNCQNEKQKKKLSCQQSLFYKQRENFEISQKKDAANAKTGTSYDAQQENCAENDYIVPSLLPVTSFFNYTPYEMKVIQCQESFAKWYCKASTLVEHNQSYFASCPIGPTNNQYFYPFV